MASARRRRLYVAAHLDITPCLACRPLQSHERYKEVKEQKTLEQQRARALREQKHEQGFEKSHAAHDALVAQRTAAATSYRRAQNGREAEYLRQSQVRPGFTQSRTCASCDARELAARQEDERQRAALHAARIAAKYDKFRRDCTKPF